MPEFNDRQASLEEARQGKKRTQRELFALKEQQRKLLRRRQSLKRQAGDEATNARIDRLTERNEVLSQNIAEMQARAQEQIRLEQEQLAAFFPFADPTENIAKLDDKYPILLFPLRVETRFRKLERNDAQLNQLWVRVYPDDIMVDTFEEMLSEVEVNNARIYWTNIWKAGGVEGEKQAAWQSLVKSHGAGRAFWIIEQVKPKNIDEEPTKADGDFLLIIIPAGLFLATEKQAVETYWRAVWLANNDQDQIDAAFVTLVQDVGQNRAEQIVAELVPQNLSDRPADESTVTNVRVFFLEMPQASEIETQQQPWMHAANTAVLPECFVLLGFNNGKETLRQIGNSIPSQLVIGPNPTAEPDEQMRLEGDDLIVPDEMKWMVDFDEAVEKGMGFKSDLTAEQARSGFDRLFVLGVRLSADIENSKEQLETLIANHQRSRKGFSILPQGAPTNNVEDDQSGYTWRVDSDISYDHFFNQDLTDDPADWRLKKDGRWLAEFLGIDADFLKASPNYYATDQCEARAMNIALWPATLGSFMEQSMAPVFADHTIESTREFFNRYVIGRGAIPAIRVGNQPYGILPATPFSRMNWLRREILAGDGITTLVPNQFAFLNGLYALINKADKTWTALKEDVSYVGKPGSDPHQVLLDVVGLHPSSVEFYQRYAETLEQLYNRLKYTSHLGQFIAAVVAFDYVRSGTDLLDTLGYDAQESGVPDILNKFFLKAANLLKGPVIDDRSLSETDPIRAYRDDETNYLEWLITAARDSHNTLRMQEGFLEEQPPNALLYLMLHHALDLSYLDTSFQLHLNASLFTSEQVLQARKRPSFIHIQDDEEDAGSQWQYLYKTEPAITNSETLTIAEYIPRVLTTLNPYLNTQIEAIEHLANVPTARLERVFAEHVDSCTYRLDAWWLGLVNVQLDLMRSAVVEDGQETGAGSYLGAFGWLEDVRPEPKNLRSVELDEELDKIFNREGEPSLMRDETNFGYIHAPSLNHAVTAAVLRNGYLSNATPDNPNSLSINLTSERVRIAMGVIEGVRNGQSLGALLGYQFERGLHDQENLFLDALIFDFRRQFSLAGNRMSETKTEDDGVGIEAIEARNVVDGLALVEHVQAQKVADQTYPFGLGSKMPEVTDVSQLNAINAQVQHIININDALADVAMAESVYQVVLGNYDRAAGTLEAFSKGNFPPTPEVVQTPRSGATLTHRVGVQLKGGLDPNDAGNITPRSKGEPAINQWLQEYLPLADDVFCEVEFFDLGLNGVRNERVTQTNLALLPIDLLYMLNMDGQQHMNALDERILTYVIDTFAPRPDVEIKIKYRVKQDGKVSFFELAPYLRNLRALILSSRPLRATDVRLPNEANKVEEFMAAINEDKITAVRDLLDPHSTALHTLAGELEILLSSSDPDIVATNAIDNIDLIITDYKQIVAEILPFGLPGATVAFAYDWRRQQFRALLRKLDDLVNRWEDRLGEFDLQISSYAALPAATSDEEKFNHLLNAGQLIWTAAISPLPGDPDQLRDDLILNQRGDFVNALNDLQNILDNGIDLSALYKDIDNEAAAIARHDLEPIDLEENKQAIVAFAQEMRAKVGSLNNDISERLTIVGELLAGDPSTNASKRVEELTEAIRQLLGEEFVILPEFGLSAEQSAEWQNAWNNRQQLLHYLENDEGLDFPIDDWLYGAARVREKMHHLESATMLSSALKNKDLELHPLQFPFREDDSWLGLQFPEKRPAYLFSADLAFVAELDAGGLTSTALREAFQIHGDPISAKAEINVEQAGSRWTVVDPSGVYEIRHKNMALDVFKLVPMIGEDKLLYTAYYHQDFDSSDPLFCGLLIDEWTEVIPTIEETTGLSFHYDRPNTEPPQTLLLATPADFTGQWEWQDLVQTLHDTLDLAQKRAIEPQHIDATAYARFLPAILSEVATWPITTTLNYAYNNKIQFTLE